MIELLIVTMAGIAIEVWLVVRRRRCRCPISCWRSRFPARSRRLPANRRSSGVMPMCRGLLGRVVVRMVRPVLRMVRIGRLSPIANPASLIKPNGQSAQRGQRGLSKAVEYVSTVNATVNFKIIGELVLIGVALTLVSALVGVVAIVRYEPLQILPTVPERFLYGL